MSIIKVSFAISFIYNAFGIYLASQGTFSPLIAAILMPLNSISIIVFRDLLYKFFCQKEKIIVSVIILLIGASLFVALIFLFAFIWSVRNGQYEDKYTPSVRILFDEDEKHFKEILKENKKKL